MSITLPSGTPEKSMRKIDVSHVSLSLQDRLGLAKVRYQKARLSGAGHRSSKEQKPKPVEHSSDKRPDSSSEILDSYYETPFPSSPYQAPIFSKELPRSARNKHAATFLPDSMNTGHSGSRKRARSNSSTERPSKAPHLSWKSSHQLPQSSPSGGHRTAFYHGRSASAFVPGSDTPSQEFPYPPLPSRPEHDDDTDPPRKDVPAISSSMISSSPPRTPPPHHATLARNGKGAQKEDGADLLLYLANSPTPANVAHRDFLPSTPPSQHATLAALTHTPQFNFADFVNVTPSPAQRTWGGRTPGGAAKTPLAAKETRKRLNFDTLAPPTSGSPARSYSKGSGSVLQLGEELRP